MIRLYYYYYDPSYWPGYWARPYEIDRLQIKQTLWNYLVHMKVLHSIWNCSNVKLFHPEKRACFGCSDQQDWSVSLVLGQVGLAVRIFWYLCELKQVFQQLILLLFHILVLCKVDLFRLSNDLFLFDFSSNASQEVFYLLTNRNTRNFIYI